ncbi:DUF6912 family protein [Demetria terragena]|uniref:DUF6912 family protein n=1 Tax=Demetria terragena TaxID=63959 RepID=UPI00037F5B1C|nr:hypothetical protein [Demetria terragena]
MSTVTRIYVALTPPQLEVLAVDGQLSEVAATAVTPALRAAYPHEDQEGLEHEAIQEAAAATLAGQRVLIAAADVTTPVDPSTAATPARVAAGPVALDRVVSFHVGDPGVVPDSGQDIDLSWYDITELADVRRLFA